jgi:hypothetical protein
MRIVEKYEKKERIIRLSFRPDVIGRVVWNIPDWNKNLTNYFIDVMGKEEIGRVRGLWPWISPFFLDYMTGAMPL